MAPISNKDRDAVLNILGGFGNNQGESTILDIGDKHTAKFILPSQQKKKAQQQASSAPDRLCPPSPLERLSTASTASAYSDAGSSDGSDSDDESVDLPTFESLNLSKCECDESQSIRPASTRKLKTPKIAFHYSRARSETHVTTKRQNNRPAVKRPRCVEQLRRFLIWRLCCDYNFCPEKPDLGFNQSWKSFRFDRLSHVQARLADATRSHWLHRDESYSRRHITVPAAALGIPEKTVRDMLMRHNRAPPTFSPGSRAIDGFDMTDYPALAEKLWTDRMILLDALDLPETLRTDLADLNAEMAWLYFKTLRGPQDYELSEFAIRNQRNQANQAPLGTSPARLNERKPSYTPSFNASILDASKKKPQEQAVEIIPDLPEPTPGCGVRIDSGFSPLERYDK